MSEKGSGLRPLSAAIADELARHFARSGRTQAQIGAAAGVSQSQLSKYLRGTRVPHIDVLDAVCEALGVAVTDVVTSADRRR